MLCDNIPVLLLTGYLGSGKTTLLNRILSNRKGIRFAVIVNDIGEVNIDAELIQRGGVVTQTDDNLIALQNGCICCSLKMDLVEQLRDLCTATSEPLNFSTPEPSKPRFDYIVIEASGICEPAPIAQTICSYNSLIASSPHCPSPKLDAVVTVVDALRLRDEFVDQLSPIANGSLPIAQAEDLAALVVEQIEFCNLILLNKVSEVTIEEREHIRAILRSIQAKAKIIDCDYCDVPFGEILDTELFDFDNVATSAAWIQGVEGDVEEEHHHHHTFLQWQLCTIMKITFAGILELHFHQVAFIAHMGHIAQPIHHRQHMLGVVINGSFGDMTRARVACKIFFHIYLAFKLFTLIFSR